MAERLQPVERKIEKSERIEVRVEHKEHLSGAEKAEVQEKQRHAAEKLKDTVEKLAEKNSETASKKEGLNEDEHQEVVLSKSYKSVMTRVESQLPPYQRAFSKVIRNPSVDKASVVIGSTVARPSAIIGGAGFAFFGLLIFMYSARTVGYSLPDSLFVVLVLMGWVGGILFDAIGMALRKTRKTIS